MSIASAVREQRDRIVPTAGRRHLTRRTRKTVLVAHVGASGTWLGAVTSNLFIGISAVATGRADLADAYYVTMDRLVNNLMPAAALTTLATGLLLALGTKWGLLRHYWIMAKFSLAIATVLVGFVVIDGAVQDTIAARAAASPATASDLLLPAIVATPVMLASATTLSITKPWGRTRLGRRPIKGPS